MNWQASSLISVFRCVLCLSVFFIPLLVTIASLAWTSLPSFLAGERYGHSSTDGTVCFRSSCVPASLVVLATLVSFACTSLPSFLTRGKIWHTKHRRYCVLSFLPRSCLLSTLFNLSSIYLAVPILSNPDLVFIRIRFRSLQGKQSYKPRP